jgi:RNA polymerase sigma factor for flagellar operon FliA
MSTSSPSLEVPFSEAEESHPNSIDLWRRYAKAGPGTAPENSLVEQYLPLVKTVVGRLAMTLPSHVNQDDLYSAGLVGLLNALRRFDPKNGTSFETYARLRIRGAVFDELRRLDWVPRSVHDKAKKVEKAMYELMQRHGGIPEEAAVARELGISLDEYQELLDHIRPASYICLDSIAHGDEDSTGRAYDVIADDSQVDPSVGTSVREMAGLIELRLRELPEIQRKVLALYYFEDLRLREIAEVFGVTESRICQIHSQAILAIKVLLQKQDPETFNDPL